MDTKQNLVPCRRCRRQTHFPPLTSDARRDSGLCTVCFALADPRAELAANARIGSRIRASPELEARWQELAGRRMNNALNGLRAAWIEKHG
jgi:hypothetical protein